MCAVCFVALSCPAASNPHGLPRLLCPWGFSKTRMLKWVTMPSSRDRTQVSHIAGDSLASEPPSWREEGKLPFLQCVSVSLMYRYCKYFLSLAIFSLSLSVNKEKFLILVKSNLLILLFRASFLRLNLSLIYSHGDFSLYIYIVSLQSFSLTVIHLGLINMSGPFHFFLYEYQFQQYLLNILVFHHHCWVNCHKPSAYIWMGWFLTPFHLMVLSALSTDHLNYQSCITSFLMSSIRGFLCIFT